MIKLRLPGYLLFLFSLYSTTGLSQEDYFKISGQYRVRSEYRHGYKTLMPDTVNAAFFIAQRARLIFAYKKNNLIAYSSIQDIRTWGDEEPLKDIPGLSVNELWIELSFSKHMSVKLGRQELVYDDHRLLGNLDWANATRSHDAVVLKYADKENKWYGHLGGAYNQNGEPLFKTDYNLKNYKFLGFAWIKKEFDNANNSISAIAIMNGLSSVKADSKSDKASITLGPLFNYQTKTWKGILGAYYQAGKTENNQSLSAYMLNAYGELRGDKLFAGIGLDYLSGNSDNTTPDHSHNFSTLYATNHKFYGYMDYFTNIPSDTKQRGLVDPYVRLGLAASKSLTTTVDVHHFSLAHENNSGNNKIQKSLGSEIDMLADYKPSPVINLQLGYSVMFATRNMELIKGGNKNNYNGWAFIMLKVSPTFFLHEPNN